jgi:ferrous iron transport protein A
LFDLVVFSASVLILSLSLMSSAASHLSPLCQLPAGATGRVCELKGTESFCQRVREMGFGEAALVTKVSGSTTSLCQVNGTRIALSHGAAMNILVERLPDSAR